MNWWNVLEISYDSDIKTIKKAYAKLLKIHNPEDDAEGYQKLRQAYDAAIKYAKRNGKSQNSKNENLNNSIENIVLEKNIVENDNNDKEQIKSRVNLYIDSINNEDNKKEKEDNDENKKIKSSVDSYMDSINNEENKKEKEADDENKKIKSSVDSYIDSINNEENKKKNETNDENKKIKSSVDLYIDSINNEENEINENIPKTSKVESYISDINNEKQGKSIDINEQINEFLGRLETIYNDMSLRIDSKIWEELLNRDVTWNINSLKIIKDKSFKFLIDHPYLPSEVWKMLRSSFNWDKNDYALYEMYPEEKVGRFFKELNRTDNLKYDYLGTLDSNSSEQYLLFRQLSFEALEKEIYYKAEKYLFSAFDIFKEDPELLKLIGNFYYDAEDFRRALEFFKMAFDINNSDLDNAFLIGEIYVLNGQFYEALPYLEQYMSFNKDNKLAINYIAYCYYYTNNLEKAKETFNSLLSIRSQKSFQRLSKVESDITAIRKYCNNINLKLDGKNVRIIKFKKYKPKLKKLAKVKHKTKIKETTDFRKITKLKNMTFIKLIVIVLVTSLFFINSHYFKDNINVSTMNKISFEPMENDETFNAINTVDDLKNTEYFKNIKMHLKNIKPLGYYKLSEPFNDKIIVSKADIDSNNLQDKIESQLFKGTFSNNIVFIFADNNCTKNNMEKDGTYIMKGTISIQETEEVKQIKEKYNTERFYWNNGRYIDCSQKEIENAEKENKFIESKDGKIIKVSKNLEEFMKNDYRGGHSLYLTDIIPSNMYVLVEGDKFFFVGKKDLDKKSNPSDYIQVFVGKIEGKYIAFIDKNFSLSNLDSNKGCNVYGYIHKFTANGTKQIPIEDGSGTYSVKAELPFLYNK